MVRSTWREMFKRMFCIPSSNPQIVQRLRCQKISFASTVAFKEMEYSVDIDNANAPFKSSTALVLSMIGLTVMHHIICFTSRAPLPAEEVLLASYGPGLNSSPQRSRDHPYASSARRKDLTVPSLKFRFPCLQACHWCQMYRSVAVPVARSWSPCRVYWTSVRESCLICTSFEAVANALRDRRVAKQLPASRTCSMVA